MSFRKKLMVLLIGLSILPILALRTFGIHNAKMIATAMMDAVASFQAGSGRSDDVTCVVVKFTG